MCGLSVVDTTVLRHLSLVESTDGDPRMQGSLRYRGPTVSYMRIFDNAEG